jgi:DNA-binding SARP family transcriptional activator/KaiC/GvpD/RAD55 family RecA-like ATPase
VEFGVLGPLEVHDEGRQISIGPPRIRAVLAVLLTSPNALVSVERLVDELWPERPPPDARALVHGYVSRLRRALRRASSGPDAAKQLVTRKPGYLLRVEESELDLHRFERVALQARAARQEGALRRSLGLYQQALDQWRGAPFADVPPTTSVAAMITRLAERRVVVLEEQFDTALESGCGTGLVAELTELATAHPLRERLISQLMLALYRSGRTADALNTFAQARNRLADELGIDPSRSLQQRYEQILRADPALNPATELDLRFGTMPDVKPVNQLPADVADFIGHAEALDELVSALSALPAEGPPPVVVVVGSPGVGKTSLAVHAAHVISAAFPDGQLYLDLAGTSEAPRDPAMMLAEVLQALGSTGADIPDGRHARAARYRSLLAGRRVLLVLDDAATADQIRPLLPATGGCAVLVTSRRLLPDLADARHVELDVLRPEEAHRLLASIVGDDRVAAEPEQAAAIVRSCGHLPLAIRIAGSKLAGRPAWSLRVLDERLADESRRLSELRAGELAVRASFDLSLRALPPSAVHAFGFLGLLGAQTVPGWVVNPLLDREHAEDVLDALGDANLVRLTETDALGQPRYRLHDLLRTYAVETTQAVPELSRAAVTRYLSAWLGLAETATDRLPASLFRSPPGDAPRWPVRPDLARRLTVDPLIWFDTERSTLLDAVALAARWKLDGLAWELAAIMVPYHDHRSRYEDWQRAHRLALGVVRDRGNVRGEAELLRGLAQVRIYRDDFDAALPNLRRAQRLYETLGDKRGQAMATAGLATIERIRGELAQALSHVGQALDIVVALGDRHTEAQLRSSVGAILLSQGRGAESGIWFEQARALARELGDRHREAVVLRETSRLHATNGEPERALRCLHDALQIFEDLDDERCVAYALLGIGQVHAAAGTFAQTGPVLERAAMIFRRYRDRTDEATCWQLLSDLALVRNDPAQARRARELSPIPAPGFHRRREMCTRPG